jgi:phage repressor protein C with HTH and peptisase S24 domain
MAQFDDHIVNQRFKLIYEALLKNSKVKNKSDLAAKLGTYNHIINNILKGERGVTLEQINKLIEIFGINANYIFGSAPFMFADQEGEAQPNLNIQHRSDVDYAGRQNITLVPNKALAGYALSAGSLSFTSELPRFSLPGLDGQLLAFEISGDSMLPSITSGDLVICEPLERGERLHDNSIYVVVTDVVVVKRIQQVKENGDLKHLLLISDNDAQYKPYNVELNEIQQILRVKSRVTSYGIS